MNLSMDAPCCKDIIKTVIFSFLVVFFLVFTYPRASFSKNTDNYYDVIIIGGGTSGIAAAVQAARMGVSVAVFEETDWLGGQMAAAGVSNMDEGTYPPAGFYHEFICLVRKYYQSLSPSKKICTCYFRDESNCFEPSVAQYVLNEIISKTKATPLDNGSYPVLEIYLLTNVATILRNGNTVEGIRTSDGISYEAKIVVDATEYGDVIPKAGLSYRAGNLSSDQIGSPSFRSTEIVNANSCIQSITYSAIIEKYPSGIPSDLQIKKAPPGYNHEIEKAFESLVSVEGNPDGAWSNGVWSWIHHVAYRGMPNSDPSAPDANAGSLTGRKLISKTGLNYANDYPWIKDYNRHYYADHPDPYPLSFRYLIDKSYREEVNCQAKLRTLQFLYYIQHNLNQPWSISKSEKYNGVFNQSNSRCDTFFQNRPDLLLLSKYMPVIPYVRESIRFEGLYTLKAKDIKRIGYQEKDTAPFRSVRHFNSSAIAIGSYAIDLHGAGRSENLENYLGETWEDKQSWRYGPFHVPLECLIPVKVDGFLAAEKNISVTRMASAAIRLQPITMRIGQAVGILAAISVKNGKQPREINPMSIQWELLKNNIPLLINNNSPDTGFLGFSDIPLDSKYWKFIQFATLHDVMHGISGQEFRANDFLSVSQVAHAMTSIRTHPSNSSDIISKYNHNWFQSSVFEIYKKIIYSYMYLKSYLLTKSSDITRGELAYLLSEVVNLSTEENNKQIHLIDVPKNHAYSTSIQNVICNGIMNPTSTDLKGNYYFYPDDKIKRGEASVIFTSLLKNINRL